MGLAVCSEIEMADLVNNGRAEDLGQVDPDLPRELLHHREENVDALDAIYIPVLSETKDVGAETRFGWHLSQDPQPKLIRTSRRLARSQVRRAIHPFHVDLDRSQGSLDVAFHFLDFVRWEIRLVQDPDGHR